jgi:hypothetical protein
MRLASWGVLSVVSCLSLAACNDDEPPLPDSGLGAGRDGAVVLDSQAPDVAPKDAIVDTTLADHRAGDAGDSGKAHDGAPTGDGAKATDGGRDASQQADAMIQACTAGGAACAAGSVCVGTTCTACGAPGEVCCAGESCGPSARCANNLCAPCGGPGEDCCTTASACADAGCCDKGVCTPSGSVCPGNGGRCESSSCGGACPDGGCGLCGAAGQSCCNIGCTSLELVCETDTDGGSSVCAVCGTAGTPCCPAESGVQCAGTGLVCSAGGACVTCGGAGQPSCT